MQCDRGYVSPYFVTDTERMEVVLDNPYILLREQKLSHLQELLPVLEQIAHAGVPLLIIAEDVEGEALTTLVVNTLRGTLQCASVEEGVVPGGGLAYIRALPALERLQLVGDRQVGVNIIKRALEEPMRQIALNAGVEGATVVQRVKAASDMIGYDAVAEAYVDLIEAGVLDPTKVSRTALQHAASVVGLLLLTEVLITE